MGTGQQRRGDTTVVAATQETQEGMNACLTPALVRLLDEHPQASVEQVLEVLGVARFESDTDGMSGNNTSMAQSEGTASEDGEKIALLVANQHYTYLDDLPEVEGETAGLASSLESRGYGTDIQEDQGGGGMSSVYEGVAAAANPGDELVFYYAGHGIPEGLCGVENVDGSDVYPHAALQGMVSSATSRGVNLRVILDCCHAGNFTNAMRREFGDEAEEAGTVANSELHITASVCRDRILETLAERSAVLDTIRGTIEEHPDRAEELRESARGVIQHYCDVLDELWQAARDAVVPMLGAAAETVGEAPEIDHYPTMGAPLQWLERAIDAGRAPAA